MQLGYAAAGRDERTSGYSSNPAGGVGVCGGRHAANGRTRRSEAIRCARGLTCSFGLDCAIARASRRGVKADVSAGRAAHWPESICWSPTGACAAAL